MRRTLLARAALAVAGAAMVLSWNVRPTTAAPGDHQLSIGVINTTRILRGLAEMKKLETDVRAMNADLVQQQQAKEAEIDKLQKYRDQNVKPGSAQFADVSSQIDEKRVALEGWKQLKGMQLDRNSKVRLKEIYDHIAAASAQVAEQQKLDLVIADQQPEIGPEMEKVTGRELQAALAARVVIYANKKADITEEVLTQADANFAKQAGAASAPAPGPGPVPIPK